MSYHFDVCQTLQTSGQTFQYTHSYAYCDTDLFTDIHDACMCLCVLYCIINTTYLFIFETIIESNTSFLHVQLIIKISHDDAHASSTFKSHLGICCCCQIDKKYSSQSLRENAASVSFSKFSSCRYVFENSLVFRLSLQSPLLISPTQLYGRGVSHCFNGKPSMAI
jgi:hypothetical protein